MRKFVQGTHILKAAVHSYGSVMRVSHVPSLPHVRTMATAFHFLISNRGGAPSAADLAGATLAPAPWRNERERGREQKRQEKKSVSVLVLGNAAKEARGDAGAVRHDSASAGTCVRLCPVLWTRAQKRPMLPIPSA